jgi:hypothetical protein
MIGIAGVTGRYAFSADALGRRLIGLVDSRGLASPAAVIAALNGMPLNAAGWSAMKKIIAEIVSGSIAFPGDLTADGAGFSGVVTEALIGTRDVSTGIT